MNIIKYSLNLSLRFLKEENRKNDSEQKYLEDSIEYHERKLSAEQKFLEDSKKYLEKLKKEKALSSK